MFVLSVFWILFQPFQIDHSWSICRASHHWGSVLAFAIDHFFSFCYLKRSWSTGQKEHLIENIQVKIAGQLNRKAMMGGK